MKYMENENLNAISLSLSEGVLRDSSHRIINGRIEAYTMKRVGTEKKIAHALGQKYVADIENMQDELAAFTANFLNRKQKNDNENKRRRSSSVESFLSYSIGDTGITGNLSKRFKLLDKTTATILAEGQRSRARSFDDCVILDTISPNTTLGDFSEISTRKLMTDLILTLNASFPDYDFSNVKPNQFQKLPVDDTKRNVNEKLSEFAWQASSSSSPNFLGELWSALDGVIDLGECDVYSFDCNNEVFDDNGSDEDFSSSLMTGSSSSARLWNFHYFFVNKSLRRIVFFTCSERIDQPKMMSCRLAEEVKEEVEYYHYYSEDRASIGSFNAEIADNSRGNGHLVDDVDWDPSDSVAGGMPLRVN